MYSNNILKYGIIYCIYSPCVIYDVAVCTGFWHCGKPGNGLGRNSITRVDVQFFMNFLRQWYIKKKF